MRCRTLTGHMLTPSNFFFFCADFLVGASLCHDFVLSIVCRRGVKRVEELVCSV